METKRQEKTERKTQVNNSIVVFYEISFLNEMKLYLNNV